MSYLSRIFLIFVFALVIFRAGISQENQYGFSWYNRSEQLMAGTIAARLLPGPQTGSIQVEIKVTWFDSDGKPVAQTSQMPMLYLAAIDLELAPAGKVRFLSFESSKPDEIVFQSIGRLFVELKNGYQGDLQMVCAFQYALSQEMLKNGLLEKIKFKENLGAVFKFNTGPAINQGRDRDLGQNQTGEDRTSGFQSMAYKRIAGQYNWFSAKLRELRGRLSDENLEERIRKIRNERNYDSLRNGINQAKGITQFFLSDVDDLITNLNSSRLGFNTDSLPGDTVNAYKERFNSLADAFNVLKFTYTQYGIALNSLNTSPGGQFQTGNPDSIRRNIRYSYEPVFTRHCDSLQSIISGEDSLRQEILPLIRKDLSLIVNGRNLDSLMSVHSALETVFLSLKLAHEQTWTNYRNSISGYRPVNEIETLNQKFIVLQNEAEGRFLDTKTKVQDAQTRALRNPEFLSRIFIWAGIAIVILILFVLLVRFMKPARLRYTGRFWQTGQAPEPLAGAQSIAPQINGGSMGDILPDEYYTREYLNDMPDVIVGKIHFSSSAIQSVYQLVHGSFLEKRAGDFGGYLFGSQYKLKSEGSVKHELIIDKVCGADRLRFEIANDMESRAEVIDEIDRNIQQNKKNTLLGWFTSSPDPSMEMPEGLQKIHRTFFKEGYQIGILLNPGSEDLKSVCFLRRKSGFFDPIPDPAAFLSWEELYRFSLNPSKPAGGKPSAPKPEVEYLSLSINSSWCDSIVGKLNFAPGVIEEVQNACEMQASPQESYQVVGYLYGSTAAGSGKNGETDLFVDRFAELSNEAAPREIPGFSLIGWWGQGRSDVFNFINTAINYHEQFFRENFQVACLMNSLTGELRIFSRKHDLSMNNNTIETEEFNFHSLNVTKA